MSDAMPRLPKRTVNGHKGTFGTVCVLGGQVAPPRVMLGGPAFSALAALRSGTGLAVLAVPGPMMLPALNAAPSATGLALPVDERGDLQPSDVAELLDQYLPGFDCLAVGPGMGDGPPQQQVLVRLIAQDQVPLVIDADALNALAALPEAAAQLASRLGCVVVLKGAHTVISDGINTHTNQTGNVALATAGSGDVLTGIIASFVGQFFKLSMGTGSRQVTAEQQGGLSLLDCARLGVHIHGLAADRWAARHGNAGLLAADLLDELPDLLRDLRQ